MTTFTRRQPKYILYRHIDASKITHIHIYDKFIHVSRRHNQLCDDGDDNDDVDDVDDDEMTAWLNE